MPEHQPRLSWLSVKNLTTILDTLFTILYDEAVEDELQHTIIVRAIRRKGTRTTEEIL